MSGSACYRAVLTQLLEDANDTPMWLFRSTRGSIPASSSCLVRRRNAVEVRGDVPHRDCVKLKRKGAQAQSCAGAPCNGGRRLSVSPRHCNSWLCSFANHLRRLLVRELLRLLALPVDEHAGEEHQRCKNADQPFDWLVVEQEEDTSGDDERTQERAVPHTLDLRLQIPVHHSILNRKTMSLLSFCQPRRLLGLPHDSFGGSG